jgi:hypothetical protein
MKRILLLLALAACSDITRETPDAPLPTADSSIDASVSIDAPDPPPPPLREAREIVSGGGRLTGTTYTLDVQIGHGVQQNKATGATYTFEGNAAVKP